MTETLKHEIPSMTMNHYQNLASRTFPNLIAEQAMVNAAMGCAGEAGEYCDLIKKVRFHKKPLDREHAARELGDNLWYLAYAAHTLGMTLGEIAELNIQKLKDRYPDGFDPERSNNRAEGDV